MEALKMRYRREILLKILTDPKSTDILEKIKQSDNSNMQKYFSQIRIIAMTVCHEKFGTIYSTLIEVLEPLDDEALARWHADVLIKSKWLEKNSPLFEKSRLRQHSLYLILEEIKNSANHESMTLSKIMAATDERLKEYVSPIRLAVITAWENKIDRSELIELLDSLQTDELPDWKIALDEALRVKDTDEEFYGNDESADSPIINDYSSCETDLYPADCISSIFHQNPYYVSMITPNNIAAVAISTAATGLTDGARVVSGLLGSSNESLHAPSEKSYDALSWISLGIAGASFIAISAAIAYVCGQRLQEGFAYSKNQLRLTLFGKEHTNGDELNDELDSLLTNKM
jgi:hypothetical protein